MADRFLPTEKRNHWWDTETSSFVVSREGQTPEEVLAEMDETKPMFWVDELPGPSRIELLEQRVAELEKRR